MPLRERILPLLGAALIGLAVLSPAAHAVNPDEMLDDPVLEHRARELSSEIRCMKCQNQSIDDSDAELARDLRILVRDRLQAGDSDRQVLDYLVDRYGEFVLLKPRFSLANLLLWLAPVASLLGGALAIWRYARNRRGAGGEAAVAELTTEEHAKLTKILDERD
ncbi:MAG: cytochrome c-type biogenesis protein CcmH [Nitratireductor sp.]|nr:cytochrome c-type biogenesis protein CcmH [Nitratireductor sp.]